MRDVEWEMIEEERLEEPKGGMDVRRIEEEVDPDFLSDAHSRTGPAESGDSCESKCKMCLTGTVFWIMLMCISKDFLSIYCLRYRGIRWVISVAIRMDISKITRKPSKNGQTRTRETEKSTEKQRFIAK
ncbi:hypothetical protein Tco_0398369 [Tanacetum coccineum]